MASTHKSDHDLISNTETLTVAEEELQVDKTSATVGRVRVRTETRELQERVHENLTRDDVRIERHAIVREVASAPPSRTENGVLIIPVVEEILIVEKRLVLKEELHIHRDKRTENVETPVTLRKQRAVVERQDTNEPHSPNEPLPPKERRDDV